MSPFEADVESAFKVVPVTRRSASTIRAAVSFDSGLKAMTVDGAMRNGSPGDKCDSTGSGTMGSELESVLALAKFEFRVQKAKQSDQALLFFVYGQGNGRILV